MLPPELGVLSVRQWGGISRRAHPRNVGVVDCSDNLNVHTAFGDLRKRHGMDLYAAAAAVGPVSVMKTAYVNAGQRLYGYAVSGANGTHYVWDSAGALLHSYTNAVGYRPHAVSINNALYIAQGDPSISRKVYWDGSAYTNARLGIVAPTVAPTPTEAGAGSIPGGTYSYRYSYYNHRTGTESAPSPAAEVSFAGTKQVQIVFTPSLDFQAYRTRIYRRLNTIENTWYMVAETANVDTYIDNLALADRTSSSEINVAPSVPPTSNIICYHRRRLWYASGNNVIWSEVDQPERVYVNENSRTCGGPNDGDPVTALFSTFTYLIVWKGRSMYVVSGDLPETFSVSRVSDTIGCCARDSVVEINGVLYWASRHGIYRMGEDLNPQLVSDAVYPFFREYDQAYLPDLSAAHDPITDHYVITGRRTSTSQFDRQLVFDTRRGVWHRWDLRARSLAAIDFNPLSDARMYVGIGHGTNANRIGRFGGANDTAFNDFGDTIPWNWTSGRIDGGTLRRKAVYGGAIAYTPLGSTVYVTVGIEADYLGSVGSTIVAMTGDEGVAKFRVGIRCNTMRFTLSGDSDGEVSIAAVEFENEQVGHR